MKQLLRCRLAGGVAHKKGLKIFHAIDRKVARHHSDMTCRHTQYHCTVRQFFHLKKSGITYSLNVYYRIVTMEQHL